MLSRSRRRSGALGHFREIDAALPEANALLQPADLHGEDHRLDRCAFLRPSGLSAGLNVAVAIGRSRLRVWVSVRITDT
jgi:hypothetical protein